MGFAKLNPSYGLKAKAKSRR